MSYRVTLHQMRAFIAVCEEGSFSRAATRDHATQSGISQHVAALERIVGANLFERTTSGVHPTQAGQRYYRYCLEALGALEAGIEEVRALSGKLTGELRIGLMPTFTRAALTSALRDYVYDHPDVRVKIVEGYSAWLTDMVLADELDFAIVPASEGRVGLRSKLLLRDREMLLSGSEAGLKRLEPVRLVDSKPLKLIAPSRSNIRRRNLDVYIETNGVQIAALMEMDAMIATLEFVMRSDWVTILPSLICVNDIAQGPLIVNPIVDPPMFAEFTIIEPSRRTTTVEAQYFLNRLELELQRIQQVWIEAIGPLNEPPPIRRGRQRLGTSARSAGTI
jgi:LysR family nitrogen assimilation transcriptional regulator